MARDYKKYYETFSGSDVLAFALFPDASPITLGQLTTISYSVYREKKPVVLLDRINVAGYTRGPRFIAGSLVFDIFNNSFVNEIINKIDYLKDYGRLKADELPLFDILIVGANEYGYSNKMKIYGCEIGDESQVVDVGQIVTNSKFTFAARDLDTFGYEDVKANFSQTQNIIFDDRPRVMIDQIFETTNYLENLNDFVNDNGDVIKKGGLTPADFNKINGFKDDWNDADKDHKEKIITKGESDDLKKKAHHGAEMVRAGYEFFGGTDGNEEKEYAEIIITKNNIKIYSDREMSKVANTVNKGDNYYIFFNAGSISYISTDKDPKGSVYYIDNGSFMIS